MEATKNAGIRPPVIGIIGYGVVGKAMAQGFPNCPISISDPALDQGSVPIPEVYLKSDFVFICVPTPMKGDGGPPDVSILTSVMREIHEHCRNMQVHSDRAVLIIKSTTPPRELSKLQADFPELRITMSPEYLNDTDPVKNFLNANLLVVGADHPDDAGAVVSLFVAWSICKPCPSFIVDLEAAGVIKYMENTFLALKVIFMNQWAGVVANLDTVTPWNDIVAAFHGDPRLGCSHGMVPGPDGDVGYGGKCFPKDIAAAIKFAHEYGSPLTLVEDARKVNDDIRSQRDWLDIEGAVS